ncbi:MAG TPA: DMT family transporter [Planctomycetota bacterium]|nr:DMT family transporter [Planctomycetota bacterium]
MGKGLDPRWSVVLAALLFSTGGAAIKAIALPGWHIAGGRSLIAAVAVFLLVPSARRGWDARTAFVGTGYAATLILFVLANTLTTAANAIFLQSTAPLYLLAFAPLVLGERASRRDVGVLFAIAAGMTLFFVGERAGATSTARDPGLGDALAAASGATWAFTLLGLRRLARDGAAGASQGAVVVGNLMAVAVAATAVAVGGATAAAPSTKDLLLLAYLGVFQLGLAYLFLARGLAGARALDASLLLFLEPALNPVWAWLAHGERPDATSLAGGAVILGATAAKAVLDARAERQSASRDAAPVGTPSAGGGA